MNHFFFGTLVVLSVLCGAATAFTYKEDFEGFSCRTTQNSAFPVFKGQGIMDTGPNTVISGYGCADPVNICGIDVYSRNGRMLMEFQYAGSRTFTFGTVVHEYFSAYFGSPCGAAGGLCSCSNQVDVYFYQGGQQVYGDSFSARNDGILGFREFRACFDTIVIVGDGLMLDDLTISRTPPTVQCPEYLPARLYERFEDFDCGKQASPLSIFAGAAVITDANPYIWGDCATYSLCYTNGVVSQTRSYGHDDLSGTVTISWGRSVYAFGGKFAPCLGVCCSSNINFKYFDGTNIAFQEDINFGSSGGVMTAYSRTVTFDRVVITGTTWAMDDIFYVDKADVIVPTDVGQCRAFVDFRAQAIDVCSPNSLVYTPTQPDTFYVPGRYWLTATATDLSGTSTCDFQVVVADQQEPTIVCPNDIITVAPAGACSRQVTYTTSISDNCVALQSQSVVPASNSFFQVGRTKVVASAVDQFGNNAQCDFTVQVQDLELPTITCPAPVTVTVTDRCGAIVTWPAPVTNDNCLSQGLTLISTYSSGFFFPVGTTVNTLTVLDSSGNSASCTFNINVIDGTKLCLCGNGAVDTSNGEACEVNQLGGRTCQSFLNGGVPIYPDGGVLECTNCQYDFSRCALCGDGRVDGTEECDGSNLNSQTCQTQGFSAGTLGCSNKCRFVTTGCTSCGNGVVDGTEECDTNAFNGKTCADYFGVGATGTLSCTAGCTINTQNCNGGPRVTAPAAGSTQYLIRGITVQATGFINDVKASVSMTDGTSTQTFADVTLTRPAGSLSVTLFPNILKASTNWKVTVKGTSTQVRAQSGVFTVKSS